MGQWIAKLTGQDQIIDQAQRDAQNQAAATAEAAAKQAKATQEAAAQAARQMELSAARASVEQAAADAAAKPIENPDVLLSSPQQGSVSAARKRRSTFGTGYSAGVNI